MKTSDQIAHDILKATFSFPVQPNGEALRGLMVRAIDADRAQRGNEVFVIQSEDGDIIDVTTSREWADWQVREDEDNPIRTIHEDTLWDGPENKEDWQ